MRINNEVYNMLKSYGNALDDTPEHVAEVAIKTYLAILNNPNCMKIFDLVNQQVLKGDDNDK